MFLRTTILVPNGPTGEMQEVDALIAADDISSVAERQDGAGVKMRSGDFFVVVEHFTSVAAKLDALRLLQ